MTDEKKPRRVQHKVLPLPPSLQVDPLTWYVYKHLSDFLTSEEMAALRFLTFCVKEEGADFRATEDGRLRSTESRSMSRKFWRIPEIERDYPGLMDRIGREGVAAVMKSARDRVLTMNADRIVLNRCPKCGGLCRTPVAKQCFECGHDWHDGAPHD